jgi:hypothetical protein
MTMHNHLDFRPSRGGRRLRRSIPGLCWATCALWLLAGWACGELAAQTPAVPNADFAAGDRQPAGWTLEGAGRWVDRQLLEVTGGGEDSSHWRCDAYRFEPARTYRFQTRVRRVSGSGTAITGPSFANRDQAGLSSAWQWVGHVFRVPDDGAGGFLRLGQWHATGAIQFDQVRVMPVVPVHRAEADMVLGEGEIVRDGQYTFIGTFDHEGSNFHRPLANASSWFNSDRWTLGGGSHVTYQFGLPGHEFLTGRVEVHVNYHTRGRCALEISRDGRTWSPLAAQAAVGTANANVPTELLPAPRLWLRLRAEDARTSLQVNRVLFTGGWGRRDGVRGPEVVGRRVVDRIHAPASGHDDRKRAAASVGAERIAAPVAGTVERRCGHRRRRSAGTRGFARTVMPAGEPAACARGWRSDGRVSDFDQ